MADNYTGTGREVDDRNKAKKAGEAANLAAGSKINQGLGGLIEKVEGPAAAPAPGLSTGEPQRTDFAPGLVGQSEYNKALSAWKAKNTAAPKTLTSAKSLGGSR